MPSIFSFFSGAGFLDLGLEHAGFSIDFVNEYHPAFLRGYLHARSTIGSPAARYGHHLGSAEVFLEDSGAAPLSAMVADARRTMGHVGFVGGPPCPDFSLGGQNAGCEGKNGRLTGIYVEMIVRHRPDFFVFENVSGMISTARHRAYYDGLKARLTAAGYRLHDRLVNCISYGVPQDRRRILLIGVRGESPDSVFPWEAHMTHSEDVLELDWPSLDPFEEDGDRTPAPGLPEDVTVEHWFRRNRVDEHPLARHFFRPLSTAKFQTIPEGRTLPKSFKRLHRWRYSPTACYGNNEVHLHPYRARRLSAAEALAIQSLPPEFELPREMSLGDMFKTIGNGFPYLAALRFGRSLMDHLTAIDAAPRLESSPAAGAYLAA